MGIEAVLLTGCAVFAAIAVAAAWIAKGCAERAQHSEHRLLRQRGAISALETAVDQFDGRMRVLHGRISANKRWDKQAEAEHPSPHYGGGGAPVCDNYRAAQIDGPNSPAARCECEFCTTMRENRAAVRRSLVPTTAHGQAERINGAADGE